MADVALVAAIEEELREQLVVIRPVAGGDISEARYVETLSGRRYFLKYHHSAGSATMFAREARGLTELNGSGAIRTPEVVACSHVSDTGFLLLRWVDAVKPTTAMWTRLGEQLAAMHACTGDVFGFEEDNFIGSLPQRNTPHARWAEFYTQERIRPQVEAALRSGSLTMDEVEALDSLIHRFDALLPDSAPSLVHGDLWGGNIMFDKHGPVLIDPAVAYAHGMMDIAMSMLFGGFAQPFYESYHAESGEAMDSDLIELYQLYYLLVHVNLFGRSYATSVMRIVRRFT